MSAKDTPDPKSAVEQIEKPMWMDEIGPCGTASGFLHADPHHPMLFVKRRRPILMVTFDNLSNVNDRDPARLPWAYKFARDNQLSHLGVYAHLPNWYRDATLIEKMRDMAADGFFKGYERCIFSGSSMGAFAALVFGQLAPNAHVMAFNPQSTLNTDLVPWEERYLTGRRQDWTLPLGDAAEAVSNVEKAFIFYDPYFEPDQKHVDRLLAGKGADKSVTLMKCWFSNHKSAVFLRKIGALKPLMLQAVEGDLTAHSFYQHYRERRRLRWYRGSLSHYFEEKGRAKMVARTTKAFRRAQRKMDQTTVDRSL
ncbi:MAG: hypothetical protein AAF231_11555 [Pseudomonadota bacterium]